MAHFVVAITLSTVSQFSYLAHIYCKKFATRRYIVSPPNAICVTRLPGKILITLLFMLTLFLKVALFTLIIIQNVIKIIFESIIVMIITYLQGTGGPICGPGVGGGSYCYDSRYALM